MTNVFRWADVAVDESDPDLKRRTMVSADVGSGYLHMGELTIMPGKEVPLHVHPTHEEGMYVMDGPLEFVLGDESGTVDKGDVLLAPPGVKHGLKNASDEPRRIMFIFPTTNVQRVYL